jgi:hypothetical protein
MIREAEIRAGLKACPSIGKEKKPYLLICLLYTLITAAEMWEYGKGLLLFHIPTF